jgi:uncharacterized protein involved in exopolysaccharide biosynthesis
MSRATDQAKAVADVWSILLRHRWRFILPAFLAMTLVLGGSLLLPRTYRGEAIFERRTDMVLAELTNSGASKTFQDPRQSLVNELTGTTSIDDTVETLRKDMLAGKYGRQLAADPDELATELKYKLNVRYDISTHELDRVRVTFVSSNPALARDAVNALVEQHISRTRKAMEARLTATSAFFAEEANKTRAAIETLEDTLLAFEIGHADLMPDNPANLQAMTGIAQTSLADVTQRRDAARLRLEAYEKSLADTPQSLPSIVSTRNPELDRLTRKLQEDEAKLSNMINVQKMMPKHPDVLDLQNSVETLRAAIAGMDQEVVVERHTQANPKRLEVEMMLTNVRAEVQSLDAQATILEQRVAELSSQTAELYPVRSEYRKLSRELEQHQRQLAFWQGNLQRVSMALTAESGDRGVQLTFIKPCSTLSRPISPNLFQIIAGSLALGLLSGSLSVFFAHRTDESFQDGTKLAEAVGLPLFGTVSELITESNRRMRRFRTMVLYPINAIALTSVLLLLMGVLYLNLQRPDLYRKLTSEPVRFVADQFLARK